MIKASRISKDNERYILLVQNSELTAVAVQRAFSLAVDSAAL
jgi:hypothetical protein